ncbi:hypothetical protein [Nonomuraea sp. H19]|uniref:hypothetical protein n=1 Tax=Nonomuraea sp. H19 TaxID=3452206 RepID=UPI003F8B0C85
MTRTTPPRPLDVEVLFPELAAYRGTTTRLHPRPGSPDVSFSSVGGPLLWPVEEPWPMCTEPHRRGNGRRPADIHRERQVLAAAWARDPDPGPTTAELALPGGTAPSRSWTSAAVTITQQVSPTTFVQD